MPVSPELLSAVIAAAIASALALGIKNSAEQAKALVPVLVSKKKNRRR